MLHIRMGLILPKLMCNLCSLLHIITVKCKHTNWRCKFPPSSIWSHFVNIIKFAELMLLFQLSIIWWWFIHEKNWTFALSIIKNYHSKHCNCFWPIKKKQFFLKFQLKCSLMYQSMYVGTSSIPTRKVSFQNWKPFKLTKLKSFWLKISYINEVQVQFI